METIKPAFFLKVKIYFKIYLTFIIFTFIFHLKRTEMP